MSVNLSIIKGCVSSDGADFSQYHPINLQVELQETGVSKGFLKPIEGITHVADMGGLCRGLINWNGTMYGVFGSKLLLLTNTGTSTLIGDVGTDKQAVSMTYGTDRLAVVSAGNLYYVVAGALVHVTDANVGTPISVVFCDGYFVLTDGVKMYVTDLTNPLVLNPLKYASAEVDADDIKCLLKVRNEILAVGRYTVEVFQDTGGALFPFSRIMGAMVMKGAIGRRTSCVVNDYVAFLGSGKNEAPAVYLASGGQTVKISTKSIDEELRVFPEATLRNLTVNSRTIGNHTLVYIHLPNATMVYDVETSKALGESFWSVLRDNSNQNYGMRFPTYCYDKWYVADSKTPALGYLDAASTTWWGNPITYSFRTVFYPTGNTPTPLQSITLSNGVNRISLDSSSSSITLRYSEDGITWSRALTTPSPLQGQRYKIIQWRKLGIIRTQRLFEVSWDNSIYLTPSTFTIT
jgi:Phage stabilisation protein